MNSRRYNCYTDIVDIRLHACPLQFENDSPKSFRWFLRERASNFRVYHIIYVESTNVAIYFPSKILVNIQKHDVPFLISFFKTRIKDLVVWKNIRACDSNVIFDCRKSIAATRLAHNGDKEQILMHRWRYPSLSLHGIEGNYIIPNSRKQKRRNTKCLLGIIVTRYVKKSRYFASWLSVILHGYFGSVPKE